MCWQWVISNGPNTGLCISKEMPIGDVGIHTLAPRESAPSRSLMSCAIFLVVFRCLPFYRQIG